MQHLSLFLYLSSSYSFWVSVKHSVPFIEICMNLFILALLRLVCRGVMIKFIAENPHPTPEVDGGIKRENLNNFILSGNWIKHPKLHMCEQTSPDDGLFLLICLYIDSWLSTPD